MGGARVGSHGGDSRRGARCNRLSSQGELSLHLRGALPADRRAAAVLWRGAALPAGAAARLLVISGRTQGKRTRYASSLLFPLPGIVDGDEVLIPLTGGEGDILLAKRWLGLSLRNDEHRLDYARFYCALRPDGEAATVFTTSRATLPSCASRVGLDREADVGRLRRDVAIRCRHADVGGARPLRAARIVLACAPSRASAHTVRQRSVRCRPEDLGSRRARLLQQDGTDLSGRGAGRGATGARRQDWPATVCDAEGMAAHALSELQERHQSGRVPCDHCSLPDCECSWLGLSDRDLRIPNRSRAARACGGRDRNRRLDDLAEDRLLLLHRLLRADHPADPGCRDVAQRAAHVESSASEGSSLNEFLYGIVVKASSRRERLSARLHEASTRCRFMAHRLDCLPRLRLHIAADELSAAAGGRSARHCAT